MTNCENDLAEILIHGVPITKSMYSMIQGIELYSSYLLGAPDFVAPNQDNMVWVGKFLQDLGTSIMTGATPNSGLCESIYFTIKDAMTQDTLHSNELVLPIPQS